MISTGTMVADGVYYNRVKRAPYWYTPLEVTRAVFKMRHVLWTELQLLDISRENMLPNECNKMEATHQKVVKVAAYEHNQIMEEAERHDQLEYEHDDDDDAKSDESSDK